WGYEGSIALLLIIIGGVSRGAQGFSSKNLQGAPNRASWRPPRRGRTLSLPSSSSPSRDGYVRVLAYIPGSRSATVLRRESVTDTPLPGTRTVVGTVRELGVSANAFVSAQRDFYRFA